jgi:hypothetical protein
MKRKPHSLQDAPALDYEIAQEKAAALGRLGRGLERALQRLTDFDAAHPAGGAARRRRAELVADAAHALWLFMVQREACGLRDSRAVMRDYGVPREVQDRAGAFPARKPAEPQ